MSTAGRCAVKGRTARGRRSAVLRRRTRLAAPCGGQPAQRQQHECLAGRFGHAVRDDARAPSTGSVKCWGYNGLGGLGDGTTNSRVVPLDVVGFQQAGNSPFVGNHAGSYAGGQSGTWAATISVDGVISATAAGGFVGTGSVNSAGIATIALGGTEASQGFTITFSGAFALQSNGTVTGSGTWTSSSGFTGTWAAARVN